MASTASLIPYGYIFEIFGKKLIVFPDALKPGKGLSLAEIFRVMLVGVRLQLERIVPVGNVVTMTFRPRPQIEKNRTKPNGK